MLSRGLKKSSVSEAFTSLRDPWQSSREDAQGALSLSSQPALGLGGPKGQQAGPQKPPSKAANVQWVQTQQERELQLSP